MPFIIGEGVTWHIEPTGNEATQLSAQVWATFPGALGGVLEWTFTHLLHGVDKNRSHTRTELHYLKQLSKQGTLSALQDLTARSLPLTLETGKRRESGLERTRLVANLNGR